MRSLPIDQTPLRVAYADPSASLQLTARLSLYLSSLPPYARIAIVCLGTDRSTGDSLGPLTGHLLSKFESPAYDLYGTLEEPVHAKNLDGTLETLYRDVRNPFVVGVDACLGQVSSVGNVLLGEGPIHPGAGVNKKLPPIGDVYVSGVVNVGGFLENFVLQSTRLHLVMQMAELIAASLHEAVTFHSKR